jgi:nitrate reductase NapE component
MKREDDVDEGEKLIVLGIWVLLAVGVVGLSIYAFVKYIMS